jgi:hypothetical protein
MEESLKKLIKQIRFRSIRKCRDDSKMFSNRNGISDEITGRQGGGLLSKSLALRPTCHTLIMRVKGKAIPVTGHGGP